MTPRPCCLKSTYSGNPKTIRHNTAAISKLVGGLTLCPISCLSCGCIKLVLGKARELGAQRARPTQLGWKQSTRTTRHHAMHFYFSPIRVPFKAPLYYYSAADVKVARLWRIPPSVHLQWSGHEHPVPTHRSEQVLCSRRL